MRTIPIPVPAECDGMTVRSFTRSHLGLSARVLTKQKHHENGLLCNGEPCRSIDILHTGDIFTIRIPEDSAVYEASDLSIDILYEDGDYLVVNKPPGMPVHPSPGHDRDSLLNAVAYHYQMKGEKTSFRPLYRLDRDTSGILIAAKHRLAVSSAVLRKYYYAVCQGRLRGSGTVDLPIRRMADSRITREVGGDKQSVTHWEALKQDQVHTLLKIHLETGRTHQIRVHLAHIGYPLAGDDLYGGSLDKIKRQALHLAEVRLACEILGIKETFKAELPEDIGVSFPAFRER